MNMPIFSKDVINHSKERRMLSMPSNEATKAMSELSSGAFKLLVYYYSKQNGWKFDDNEIAKTLNITVKRFKEIRKELVDKDYLLIGKGRGDYTNYFVGKSQVAKRKLIYDYVPDDCDEPMFRVNKDILIGVNDEN